MSEKSQNSDTNKDFDKIKDVDTTGSVDQLESLPNNCTGNKINVSVTSNPNTVSGSRELMRPLCV